MRRNQRHPEDLGTRDGTEGPVSPVGVLRERGGRGKTNEKDTQRKPSHKWHTSHPTMDDAARSLGNPLDHRVSALLCFGAERNMSTAPWVESGDKTFTEESLIAEYESGFSVTLEQ